MGGDILIHYGIPGQKKGVRRFQYLDRRWTPEGKIRYGHKGEDSKSSNDWMRKQFNSYDDAREALDKRLANKTDYSKDVYNKLVKKNYSLEDLNTSLSDELSETAKDVYMLYSTPKSKSKLSDSYYTRNEKYINNYLGRIKAIEKRISELKNEDTKAGSALVAVNAALTVGVLVGIVDSIKRDREKKAAIKWAKQKMKEEKQNGR